MACASCSYAANLEVATSRPLPAEGGADGVPAREKVHTPRAGTIDDVSKFLELEPKRFLKSLVYLVGDKLVLVGVTGLAPNP